MRIQHLINTALTTTILSAAIFTTAGCENADRDQELIRIDAAPHANLVNQAKEDWSWIEGTTWAITSIEGQKPIQGTRLWIRFEGKSWMSGSSGCNQLSGSYERRGIDGLQISKVASTRMHCPHPEGIMQQESRFLHILSNTDAYHAEPNTLTLSTNAVTMLTFKRIEDDQ